ncbi:hypothetical protein B0H14DRAFT_2600016 [Mycena olivaceomarginata]|nr:hypothetical protein B0H14DRAFT_2600016 [Mycena olivaceomarginata]
MLEQDQEKLQHRNKELDDAYRVTGLMLTKAGDLAQQWADSLGNAETQLNERNIELKNAQDQLVLYRQAVKPHQDHVQVLQDEEDIMALQQLQTADEDLHAKFVNLEQEQHQTLKANKILEVEVAKKQETVMNLAERVKKLNAELERAYQDIKYQNGLQAQKNNEIEELQSQLVTGPKAPSFAEESAIAKMQKDLDILEEQLAMDMLSQGHREQERHKAYQELEGCNAQMEAQNQQIQSNLSDQTSQLHELQQKHNELQNKWDVQRSVLSLSSREQERHKAYQELEGRNAQMEAQNQQIQTNLNDPQRRLNLTSLYHQLMLYLDKILSKPTIEEQIHVSRRLQAKNSNKEQGERSGCEFKDGSGDSGREERQQRENQKANEKYPKATKGKQRNTMEAFDDTVEVWTENGWIVLMSKIVALRMDICRAPSGMGAGDRLDRMNVGLASEMVFTEERRELHRRGGDGWENSEWGGRFTQRVGSNDKKTVRFMSRQRMKHTEDPDQGRGSQNRQERRRRWCMGGDTKECGVKSTNKGMYGSRTVKNVGG